MSKTATASRQGQSEEPVGSDINVDDPGNYELEEETVVDVDPDDYLYPGSAWTHKQKRINDARISANRASRKAAGEVEQVEKPTPRTVSRTGNSLKILRKSVKAVKKADKGKTRKFSVKRLFERKDDKPILLSKLPPTRYVNNPTLVDAKYPTMFKLRNTDKDDEINNINFYGIPKNSIKEIIYVSKKFEKKTYDDYEQADFFYLGKEGENEKADRHGDPTLIYSYTIQFKLEKDPDGIYTGTWYKGSAMQPTYFLYAYFEDDSSKIPIQIIDEEGKSDGFAMVINRTDDKGNKSYIYFRRDGVKGELCNVMKEPFKPSKEENGIKCDVEFKEFNIKDADPNYLILAGGRSSRRHKKTMKRIRKTTKRIRKTIKKHIRKTMKRK